MTIVVVGFVVTIAAGGCGSGADSAATGTSGVAGSSAATETSPSVVAPAVTESDQSSAATSVPPAATAVTTAAPTEPCTASDLVATADPLGDSLMSNTKLVINVTNRSNHRYALPDTPPTLAGIDANGTYVPLVGQSDQTYFGSPPALAGLLEVGGKAVVWVGGGQPEVCDPLDATQTWTGMVVGLPDGSQMPFTTMFDTKCGISGITKFGTP